MSENSVKAHIFQLLSINPQKEIAKLLIDEGYNFKAATDLLYRMNVGEPHIVRIQNELCDLDIERRYL